MSSYSERVGEDELQSGEHVAEHRLRCETGHDTDQPGRGEHRGAVRLHRVEGHQRGGNADDGHDDRGEPADDAHLRAHPAGPAVVPDIDPHAVQHAVLDQERDAGGQPGHGTDRGDDERVPDRLSTSAGRPAELTATSSLTLTSAASQARWHRSRARRRNGRRDRRAPRRMARPLSQPMAIAPTRVPLRTRTGRWARRSSMAPSEGSIKAVSLGPYLTSGAQQGGRHVRRVTGDVAVAQATVRVTSTLPRVALE